ncbi:MAG TPA: tetratricopeptide repeat protein [Blastocatellia bacterium]|nr:tetratricopeptide repeat protein [Blastocatellia bacterium]
MTIISAGWGGATGSFSQQITFNKRIAPILFANCAVCHHTGGAGPFGLIEYQEVKKRAKDIVAVTGSRYMPPWLPEPGHGEFADARRLNDEQIETLRRWVEQGMIEGDKSDLPPAPEFPAPGFKDAWRLGRPDLVIEMPQSYALPAGTTDLFRNFVIPLPITKARYVKAVEFLPGDKKIFHHANILIDRTGGSRRRDELDPEIGFGGMDVAIESESFDPDSHFLFWKPGSAPWVEPDGMAWVATPGTDLVLNLHMQPSGKPETIKARIGLYFTDRPPSKFPMLLQLEHDGAIDIPPGKKDFVITDEFRLPVDVDALAVYPHAHYIGKDLRASAVLPDGTKKPLVWIKDWDLNWQAVYRYEQPIFLPAGTVISMRFTYDNSAANPRNPNSPPKRVVAGDKATDEMGHLWLQVLPRSGPRPQEDARMVLQQALMRQRLKKYPSDFTAHFNLGAALQQTGKIEEAVSHFRGALQVNPQSYVAHTNLGAALQELGQIEQAISHYLRALRIKPDYFNARYNLGNLPLRGCRIEEAVGHFREALRLQPDDAGAHNSLGSALGMRGKLDEAISEFAESLRLNSENADFHVNLAYALSLQGKIDEAITHYEQALRLKPENSPESAETLNELGVLYGRKGKLAEAVDKFERALRVNPDHAGAGENLKRARTAMEKMKTRKP